jgi:hypothetical protein
VDRNVRQQEYLRYQEHRRATVLAAILVGLLGVQLGCGGDSSGLPGGGGAPPPVFTTIDAPEAGTNSEPGTFAVVVNLSGDVAGITSIRAASPTGLFETPRV